MDSPSVINNKTRQEFTCRTTSVLQKYPQNTHTAHLKPFVESGELLFAGGNWTRAVLLRNYSTRASTQSSSSFSFVTLEQRHITF